MAVKDVKGYFIRYRVADSKTFLTIHFTDGGFDVINNLDVNQARFLVDLLRNEKPLVFNTTDKILATSNQEPVGEGE